MQIRLSILFVLVAAGCAEQQVAPTCELTRDEFEMLREEVFVYFSSEQILLDPVCDTIRHETELSDSAGCIVMEGWSRPAACAGKGGNFHAIAFDRKNLKPTRILWAPEP